MKNIVMLILRLMRLERAHMITSRRRSLYLWIMTNLRMMLLNKMIVQYIKLWEYFKPIKDIRNLKFRLLSRLTSILFKNDSDWIVIFNNLLFFIVCTLKITRENLWFVDMRLNFISLKFLLGTNFFEISLTTLIVNYS